MGHERFFKPCNRYICFARRVQRDRVDIRKARIAWFEDSRALELAQCGVGVFQPHQSQSERMTKHRALWRYFESVAQDALTIRVAALRTVHVGEIHVCGNEQRL